jgi:7,8-dihydropterin-6-yl-methyl-4-(beta-D-ribofuranosyl)aminobenzene 5'-phosphate synthase
MKITILCENEISKKAAKKCIAEWGLSFYIQTKTANILFDTGHTDIYWKNAKRLGINLQETDFVVLSHFHWDHTGGLRFHEFNDKKQLIAHPEVINKLPTVQATKINKDFEIKPVTQPYELDKDIIYLGQIPRTTNFEQGGYKDDKMLDDSAIAIKTPKGTVLITGCSHAGICNICEYAKAVTGQDLYAVIGGFHLFEEEQSAIEETIEYFQANTPEIILPMHCVDFQTLAKFHFHFGCEKYACGDVIEL